MRPNGVDANFRLVKYTRAQDSIHEAVEDAIDERMSPKEFMKNVSESWEIVQKEQLNQDLKELK